MLSPLREHLPDAVLVLDQRRLPFEVVECELRTLDDACVAIRDMIVRGAPLIGVTAAYGLWLAVRAAPVDSSTPEVIGAAAKRLRGSRPTAVNLAWAIETTIASVEGMHHREGIVETLLGTARRIAEDQREACRLIGEYGVSLIEEIAGRRTGPVNILTHCNAGWLGCTGYGTATAPIYLAHERGIDLHVWVDETRPRNQGARLTAWELEQSGVPHTVVVDNAGGHLMQHGLVDLCIVGCDRATRRGDVCNKIGTYLKALAARDNDVPFYVALPTSTIDYSIEDGIRSIPIEERSGDEVRLVEGVDAEGIVRSVSILPTSTRTVNFGFDVTPARLVDGLITERGIVSPANLATLQVPLPSRGS